ncbi:hypothetical protein [Sinorhizobium medicae]|uniref:hypothetical protein n=1 Tax=Sinorhizobium medicae TaxID=110321 RepID=UPI000C7D8447|nr:hypothetical protein [Sinorhizobium medicae]PLU02968.1 hypothetical protein BMJ32_11015 [Sinorhizobium medicae]PLU57737.1 hypothetical protein BMJ23_07360 [Sinorhizobium medicae]
MLRSCVAVAPFLLLAAVHSGSAATPVCNFADALLDKGTRSEIQKLKDSIICLAKQISQTNEEPVDAKAASADKVAAQKVIILAGKIGSGAPLAAAKPTTAMLGLTATSPTSADAKSTPNHSSIMTKTNRVLAEKIICQTNALLGQSPPQGQMVIVNGAKCGPDTWSKDNVIELASKIIGNG